MITFEYQYDANSPKVHIELSSDSTLSDVIEQFERFLLAAGYSFYGTLDFIEEEATNVE